MAGMKDMLIGNVETLSAKSGYGFEELMERWFDYCDEGQKDGEPADWDHFAAVTMEHDW